MSKKILALISAITIFMVSTITSSAAPSQYATTVYYYVYRNGAVTIIKNVGADNIEDLSIPLFQERNDANAIRNDGYCFSCATTVDLTGVSVNNSVRIEYGNPVTYNADLQTLNGARNRLYVTLTYNDGTEQTYYYGSQGLPGTVGDAPLLQIGDFGTVEYNDEVCLTLLKGVAVDRIRISIELYVDLENPTPIPMSWWDNGSITFGELSYMDELVGGIKEDTGYIVEKMDVITNVSNQDRVDINNMQSDVADRQEQAGQLVEDIKVDKPTITDDVLNPMDKVDSEALNTMGGVLGAVFVSPTLGSIAVMTLVFGLIGYILYGKR